MLQLICLHPWKHQVLDGIDRDPIAQVGVSNWPAMSLTVSRLSCHSDSRERSKKRTGRFRDFVSLVLPWPKFLQNAGDDAGAVCSRGRMRRVMFLCCA